MNMYSQMTPILRHNPYFNRWFSAIEASFKNCYLLYRVTILILIDGFLQYACAINNRHIETTSQSLF